MKRYSLFFTSCLTVLLLLPGIVQGQESLVLVNEQVTPQIILPQTPTEAEQYAAQELSTYLTKITSKDIPVIATDTLSPEVKRPIILGKHPLNTDLNANQLGEEESVISIEPSRIRIAGGYLPERVFKDKKVVQERGTLYGVYNFLDRLGVRWYRPEAWGEYVPYQPAILLPCGRTRQKPNYQYRGGAVLYQWYSAQTPEQRKMMQVWAVRNRQNWGTSGEAKYGGVHSLLIAHNYDNLLPPWKYFKEHPEYFALINGKREATGQPCLSNPEVQKIMIANVIDAAKKNPQWESVSLEPTDSQKWCECEFCRALDDPELLARNGSNAHLGRASLSNRVAFFNNLVARELAKEVPGVKVAWLAYTGHSEVPTKITAFEPNTLVGPAPMAAAYGDNSRKLQDPASRGNKNFVEILEGYSKLTSIFTYEYWSGGFWSGPLPLLYVMEDRLKNYKKYEVQGVWNEFHPQWGPQTIVNYFYTRLLWDSELDLNKAMQEFCRNYYGPGAEPMLKYHHLINKTSMKGPAWHQLGYLADRVFKDNDELIAEMGEFIQQAKQLIGEQEPFSSRFKGDYAGYQIARLRNEFEHNKKDNNLLLAVSTWAEIERLMRSDPSGATFNQGLIKSTLSYMGETAGIGGVRNQLTTLKNNPGASVIQNINENWKFAIDPQKTGLEKGVTKSEFNDSNWHDVNATSTWQDQGYNYQGTVWYRKSFDLGQKIKDRRYALFFGAIDGDATIYINGAKAGEHLLGADFSGWDKDFMIDVTQHIREGENKLAVQVTKTFAVGGIYKGVSLLQF